MSRTGTANFLPDFQARVVAANRNRDIAVRREFIGHGLHGSVRRDGGGLMREVNVTLPNVHSDALTAALRSVLGANKALGISTYGSTRPVSIWLADSTTAPDDQQATAIAQAHDPVFLSVDKATIIANGVDVATVHVIAPKLGAAVTLLIGTTPIPVTLTGGVGNITVVSVDPAAIPISVQNPANRTTDTVIVEAI